MNEQHLQILKNLPDIDFNLESYMTREERHYCTLLFKWLWSDSQNVDKLLGNQVPSSMEYRLFYEYAPIREYLNKIKCSNLKIDYKELRNSLNHLLVNLSFNIEEFNDIQKKKIDLAIQTKMNNKLRIYLIEVKFVGGFNKKQLELTENYGEIMKELFKIDYEIFLIGVDKYLHKEWLDRFNKTSWEYLISIIDDLNISKEIEKGIKNIS